MFARFDENPEMTLQDIKETKCYARTHTWTDAQRENNIPTTNKVCGGYNHVLSQCGSDTRLLSKKQEEMSLF